MFKKRDKMVKHGPLVFEFNKVNSSIYLGTNMCCQVHFEKRLLKKGLKVDISMEGEKVDQPFGVDYYLWLPIKDHTTPKQKQLQAGVTFMQHVISKGEKCYVHCQRGHGRGPTMVAAYLISTGMTTDEAVSFIKNKRKVIHINTKQKNALKKFERYWKR